MHVYDRGIESGKPTFWPSDDCLDRVWRTDRAAQTTSACGSFRQPSKERDSAFLVVASRTCGSSSWEGHKSSSMARHWSLRSHTVNSWGCSDFRGHGCWL